MNRLYSNTVAAFLIATAMALASCANAPQNAREDVVVAYASLTVATNAFADVHDAELARREAVKRGEVADGNSLMPDSTYKIGKQAAIDATALLDTAATAAANKDYGRAEVLIVEATALINKIALYNGGKK